MRKGHSITGLQVVSQDTGKDLGKVLDLIFDHDANRCLALIVREKSLLHSAQVVRWENIVSLGKDAVIIGSESSVINPSDDGHLRVVLERDTHLSGTQILTDNGQEIGSFGDVYLDEISGQVVGYEVSGGFFADTVSGKRYIPAGKTDELRVGDHVLLAPPSFAGEFERQATEEPGGLKAKLGAAQEAVTGQYDAAKEKASGTYTDLANASVEKQKEFVVGKTAGQDVFLPAPTLVATDVIVEDNAPMLAADEISDEMKHGPLLVGNGEVITRNHADTAESAGVLHQLLVAAGAHSGGSLLDTAKEKLGIAGDSAGEKAGETQSSLEEKAIGQQSALQVDFPNGSTLLAPGMIITREIMETARLHGKEKEVVAAGGLGATSNSAQNVYAGAAEKAGSVWETIKEKTAELTGTAQEKKSEYDAANEQKSINHALGRPVTRVVLSKDDSVILNTGDIITHKAIELARQNDMLDILLTSVHDAAPELTQESLRVKEHGEAALV